MSGKAWPEIPTGYKPTGAFRVPKDGEWFIGWSGTLRQRGEWPIRCGRRVILAPKKVSV